MKAQGFQPVNETKPAITYTQSDLSAALLVSVKSVKKYLERINQIWVWEAAQFKNADGRYTELCLSRLREYQAACGVSKVVDGQLVDNPGMISFNQFQAQVWAENNFSKASESALKVSGFTPENAGFQAEIDDIEHVAIEIFSPVKSMQLRTEAQERSVDARQSLLVNLGAYRDQLLQSGAVIGDQIGKEVAAVINERANNAIAGELNQVVQGLSGK